MALENVRQVVFPKEGARKKYEIISNCYQRKIGVLEIKPNMDALNLIKITKGEKILDVGFGTGWVLEKILSMGSTGEVHGIDFARGMHRVTIERLKKKQLENRVILIQGDILSMPYKEESFDVVFASFIIDLLETTNIQKLLIEIKRVLKPHGRLVIVAMTKGG